MGNGGFLRRWSRLKSHGGPAAAGEAARPRRAPTGDGAGSGTSLQGSPLRDGGAVAPAPTAGTPDGAGLSVQHAEQQQAPELPPVAQTAPHPPVAPAPPDRAPQSLPTLDDIAALGPDSDFSAFVSQGVDKNVQRLAMKKLFSDPHFSVLDGLDIYIDDYSKADPIPAAVLASLDHARSVFARMLDNESAQKGEGDRGPAPGKAADDPPPPDHHDDA